MSIINELLLKYECNTVLDYKNALKEIIQEITLLGLYRKNFFNKAAFYGGSALRIAHKLDRFSEDLDFTLLEPDISFDIKKYFKVLQDEFFGFSLNLDLGKKEKAIDTSIDSAFIKGNTLEHLLLISGIENSSFGINKNDLIKIKLEIDTNPPKIKHLTDTLFKTTPLPFSYKILSLPFLFSGKLHAILCRNYKSARVKGRDYYDLIWYINRRISPDLNYLKEKMLQTGDIDPNIDLTKDVLMELLDKKFTKVDFEQAKNDILPFIKNKKVLDVWSKEFFSALTKEILL